MWFVRLVRIPNTLVNQCLTLVYVPMALMGYELRELATNVSNTMGNHKIIMLANVVQTHMDNINRLGCF